MVFKAGMFCVASAVLLLSLCGTAMAQMNPHHPPQPPPLYPRRPFSWQRMVLDELIHEKAFVVDRPGLQTAVLISRDPQLGEAGHYGSVSVYDFSSTQPVTAIKPYFQGQPCFLLPGPAGDFNSTLTMLTDRNGQTVNATAPPVELTASEMPLSDADRASLFHSNPVLIRMCSRQPIFTTMLPDPLAFDPYPTGEMEQLIFSVVTLEGSVTITFTWEMMTR